MDIRGSGIHPQQVLPPYEEGFICQDHNVAMTLTDEATLPLIALLEQLTTQGAWRAPPPPELAAAPAFKDSEAAAKGSCNDAWLGQ